jgi:hypothetical protein
MFLFYISVAIRAVLISKLLEIIPFNASHHPLSSSTFPQLNGGSPIPTKQHI